MRNKRKFPFNPADKEAPAPVPTLFGFRRFRLFMVAIHVVAALAIVEYVWVRPHYMAKPEPHRNVMASATLAPALRGEPRVLAGLQATTGTRLAPLNGLAEGSKLAQETQVQTSLSQRLPLQVVNSVGMHFRLVPGGTYVMGSPASEAKRWVGEVQQVASIPAPLYVGMFEVTQAQWVSVMGNNPSWYKSGDTPVEEVSWEDCIAFTEALCKREGVPPGIYRLPTEKEWEYACRAGTSTAYCFGTDVKRLGQYADYIENSLRRPGPVGQRLPNAYGLFDMHGNVWEWCLDYFVNFLRQPDQEKGSEEYWRCIRGGNWRDPPENCRSANRVRLYQTSKGNILGFRVVRSVPELQAGASQGASAKAGATGARRQPGVAPETPLATDAAPTAPAAVAPGPAAP